MVGRQRWTPQPHRRRLVKAKQRIANPLSRRIVSGGESPRDFTGVQNADRDAPVETTGMPRKPNRDAENAQKTHKRRTQDKIAKGRPRRAVSSSKDAPPAILQLPIPYNLTEKMVSLSTDAYLRHEHLRPRSRRLDLAERLAIPACTSPPPRLGA